MDDREMLELAAKAAGMGGGRGDQIEYHNGAVDLRDMWILDGEDFIPWSPLADDGDALRLAARLRISIDFDDCRAWCRGGLGLIQEFWGGDHDACYKRAVVRVAAEIGRGM